MAVHPVSVYHKSPDVRHVSLPGFWQGSLVTDPDRSRANFFLCLKLANFPGSQSQQQFQLLQPDSCILRALPHTRSLGHGQALLPSKLLAAAGLGAHLDATIINEHVVHLEVGVLAGLVIVVAQERVAQAVPSLPVLDDVAGCDGPKP